MPLFSIIRHFKAFVFLMIISILQNQKTSLYRRIQATEAYIDSMSSAL